MTQNFKFISGWVANIVAKGENADHQHFLLFPRCCQNPSLRLVQPFPKGQILESFKVKEFADNNFKFDENSSKFSKQVENTGGKRRNSLLLAISPFPTMFSKDLHCR